MSKHGHAYRTLLSRTSRQIRHANAMADGLHGPQVVRLRFFDPRMPEAMTLFIQRVERDDKMIAELEADVRAFLDEMAKKLAQLIALQQKAAA